MDEGGVAGGDRARVGSSRPEIDAQGSVSWTVLDSESMVCRRVIDLVEGAWRSPRDIQLLSVSRGHTDI